MDSYSISGEDANRHFKEKDIDLELNFVAVDQDDIEIRHDKEKDALVVGYLAHDFDPEWDAWPSDPSPHDDIGEEGVFIEFRDEVSRDEFMERMESENRTPLVVDRYQHGLVHFSVANTMEYPDRRWDVAPSGVFVPNDYLQEQFNKEEITREELIAQANASLNAYSDYCNGSVYGCVVETFMKNENGAWEQVEEEAVWGHVGRESAEETLKESFLDGYTDFPKAPSHEMSPGM